ncbi:hypothetical protein KRX11_05150 [Pasteurellaceae bacterium TAE3-ERU1]|nr:hypothetical protein [Pasteurellaceae bacterium TAE3-ERU1]
MDKILSKLELMILGSAFLGYAISYSGLYLFHVLIFIYLILFLMRGCVKKSALYFSLPIIILIFYSLLTLVWSENILHSLKFIFYYLCAFFCIFVSLNYISSRERLGNVIRVYSILFFINVLIGIAESFTNFRLPISPFSQSIQLFGYNPVDMSGYTELQVESLLSKPTGFNYNLNDFGFVYLLFFPIVFYNNKFYLKLTLVLIGLLLVFVLGSKGFTLGYMIFIFLSLVLRKYNTRNFLFFLIVAIFSFFVFIFVFNYIYDVSFLLNHRGFSIVEQLNKAYNMINDGGLAAARDSTGERLFMYIFGLNELISSYGFGLGVGGITNKLIEFNYPMQSFHFFILEMLIDFGIVFYIPILFFYFYVLHNLYLISKKEKFLMGNISKALVVIWLIFPISSISPSSIVYNLPFWLIVGLSLSLIKIVRSDCENHNFICRK